MKITVKRSPMDGHFIKCPFFYIIGKVILTYKLQINFSII